MEALYISDGVGTPKTTLNRQTGKFEIVGSSYMSNPLSYYDDVIKWLEKYSTQPLSNTRFVFKIEYANSATVKLLNEIIQVLLRVVIAGKKLEIIWYYYPDDEDSIEIGKQFEIINKFPITYIEMED